MFRIRLSVCLGLPVFAMVGFADEDTNPVSLSLAGGFSWRGLIPGRDDDTLGIGYFYNDLEEPSTVIGSRLTTSSQGAELYYDIAITGAIGLTFDVQWVKGAFPNVDDAIILGLRLNLDF